MPRSSFMTTVFSPRFTPFIRAVGFAFVLLCALCANAVYAVDYGGFGGRPANPRPDNPRTDSIFVYTLNPGASTNDGVIVANNSGVTKTLLLYASDSTRSSGGGFACEQASEAKEEVGAWIHLEKKEVVVEPSQKVTVPFTVHIPDNASVGEHNGCILIQEKKEAKESTSGVNLSIRSGIRVAITVPGELVRKLEIIGLQVVRQKNGSYLFHPEVKNVGNVSIDANVRVATQSLFGFIVAEKGGTYPILRDETSEWNFEIAQPFWGGWYRSSLDVSYDEHAEASVGVESGKGQTALHGPTAWFFSFPTWKALVVELLALVALFFALRAFLRFRQLKHWIKTSWVPYTTETDESVTTIAERHGIPWKIIATANHIKAPYLVKAGSQIRVPKHRGATDAQSSERS